MLQPCRVPTFVSNVYKAIHQNPIFCSLPMLAGTVSPSNVTEQVADDTASLADAGILFPADPAGILFPAVPAGMPVPAGPSCRPCWP